MCWSLLQDVVGHVQTMVNAIACWNVGFHQALAFFAIIPRDACGCKTGCLAQLVCITPAHPQKGGQHISKRWMPTASSVK